MSTAPRLPRVGGATRRTGAALLLVAAVVASATGCVGAADEPRRVGEAFAAAVAEDRLDDACALLTPAARDDLGDDCAASLASLGLDDPGPVESVEAYGRAALVRHADSATFLARTGDTWQVRATGCSPPADAVPADCPVTGG